MTVPDPGLLDEAAETTTHTEPVDADLNEDPRWTHRDFSGYLWYYDEDDRLWYCEDGNYERDKGAIEDFRGELMPLDRA